MKNEHMKPLALANLENVVFEYPRKHDLGFTREEIKDLLECVFPDITVEQFGEKLGVCTGGIVDGDFLTYPEDVKLGIKLCIEKREMTPWEWD